MSRLSYSYQFQFLENADNLFQASKHKFQGVYNPEAEKLDVSLFVVAPDRKAWNSIWKHTGAKGKGKCSTHFTLVVIHFMHSKNQNEIPIRL